MKRRAPSATAAAAPLLALAACLAASACLNPRPEELPSDRAPPLFSGESDGVEADGDPSAPETFEPNAPTDPTPGATESPRNPAGEGLGDIPDAGASDAGVSALQTGIDTEPSPETDAGAAPE